MKKNFFKRDINDLIVKEGIKNYRNSLYNFINKSINFSEDAFDLLQNSLLKAIKYSSSYKQDKDVKTWLYSIAKNEIKSYYKDKKKNLIDLNTNIEEVRAVYKEDSKREVIEIYEILKKEKPLFRTIFYLFYEEEFTIEDISKISSCSSSNVKQILYRLREKIKRTLEVKDEKR